MLKSQDIRLAYPLPISGTAVTAQLLVQSTAAMLLVVTLSRGLSKYNKGGGVIAPALLYISSSWQNVLITLLLSGVAAKPHR